MHFSLSDQQLEMQNAVRRFLAEQCPVTRAQRIFNSDDGFDAELWRGLCDLGIAGLVIPIDFGGMGLELLDLALESESLGEAAAPGPFLGHVLASMAIAWAGSDEQRRRWLPQLATGELLATVAFAEKDSHWQPEEWSLSAAGSITGVKYFVPYAQQAQLIVVGMQGGQLAVVEPSPASVSCTAIDAVDRTRRMDLVRFSEAGAQILTNSSLSIAHRLRDAALVLLAADAFGGAQRCVRMSVDYANTREQYGAKIGQFQGLKYQIVDAAIDVEPARSLYWYAAHAFAHIPEEAERMAALAKSHLVDVYLQAARAMVDVHGGLGYTWEFEAHIFLKRAMFDYAFMGAPSVHRRRAIELAGWTS